MLNNQRLCSRVTAITNNPLVTSTRRAFPLVFEGKPIVPVHKHNYELAEDNNQTPADHNEYTKNTHLTETFPRLLQAAPKLSGPVLSSRVTSGAFYYSPFHHVAGSSSAPFLLQQRRAYAQFVHREDHNYETTEFPEFDNKVENGQDNRNFAYLMVGSAGLFTAIGAKAIAKNVVTLLGPPAAVVAAGILEVDLSTIPVGKTVIVKWRGKPVFIRHRDMEEVDEINKVNLAELRDPQTDADRVLKPDWLIVLGICTHLGCVPIGDAGEYHGWFCPCHGSHYDRSGRIRKGPAPLNLEIPPYRFVNDNTVILG